MVKCPRIGTLLNERLQICEQRPGRKMPENFLHDVLVLERQSRRQDTCRCGRALLAVTRALLSVGELVVGKGPCSGRGRPVQWTATILSPPVQYRKGGISRVRQPRLGGQAG